MRLLACLAFCLVSAGCSHTQVSASSNSSPGASASGGSVSAQTSSSALVAVLIMGMFIAAAADDIRAPQSQPMDPQRRVVEQDCTRPIDTSITLKCR